MRATTDQEIKKILCNDCGRTNIGYQVTCLVCDSDLDVTYKQKKSKLGSRKTSSKLLSACTSCGEQMDTDMLYCTSCGTKKEEIVTPSCSGCGVELDEDQFFCTECGMKIDK